MGITIKIISSSLPHGMTEFDCLDIREIGCLFLAQDVTEVVSVIFVLVVVLHPKRLLWLSSTNSQLKLRTKIA